MRQTDRGTGNWIAVFFATGAGVGFLPFAPGTWGSILPLPLIYVQLDWEILPKLLFWIPLFFIGVWSASRFDAVYQTQDNSKIVIDEILGMAIACLFASNLTEIFMAFLLFRVFDILKPPPIRWVDRLSKKKSASTGLTVILDDLIAGAFALGCFALLTRLPWFSV